MPKPIKLTDDIIETTVSDFRSYLNNLRMNDGEVAYSRAVSYDDKDTATIIFSAEAYAKMIRLVDEFSTEIAWHGVGERADDTTFKITDIMVYPQTVTGAYVDMDPADYTQWKIKHLREGDSRINNIVMQGHSHVNMGVTPSGTDLGHQQEILRQLGDDMFYIFIIINKRSEINAWIYDLEHNIQFSGKEVIIRIGEDGDNLDEFIKEAKSLVKTYSVAKKPEKPTKETNNTKHNASNKDTDIPPLRSLYPRYNDDYDYWD